MCYNTLSAKNYLMRKDEEFCSKYRYRGDSYGIVLLRYFRYFDRKIHRLDNWNRHLSAVSGSTKNIGEPLCQGRQR